MPVMPMIADLTVKTVKDEAQTAIDEPLQKLARFSYDWASTLCGPNSPCSQYHKIWSTVRQFESKGALPAASQLFREELEHSFINGHQSVLISGAADTALLAIVNDASRSMHSKPSITLLDRCMTPVEQNKLYARYLDIKGQFICDDAKGHYPSTYDIIMAHNFLLFFNPDDIHALMKAWSLALNSSGRIVMCQSIQKYPTNCHKNLSLVLLMRPTHKKKRN